MSSDDIVLTTDQKNAIEDIIYWYDNYSSSKYYVLSGFAGTGKTTIINHLINNSFKKDMYLIDLINNLNNTVIKDKSIKILAYTGKAVNVLKNKGIKDAQTIHSFMYTCYDVYPEFDDTIYKNKEEYDKLIADGVLKPKLNCVKKDKKDYGQYKLIIIDECSMLTYTMFNDILSTNIPVLFVGDSFQISMRDPDNNFNIFYNPNYQLTEIVRQVKDSPIIKLSMDIRLNGTIPNYGVHEDTYIISPNIKDTNWYLKTDQVIVGKNITRNKVNNTIRSLLGYPTHKNPQPGEKMIVCANNGKHYNGEILYLTYNNKSTYNMVDVYKGYIEYCVNNDDIFIKDILNNIKLLDDDDIIKKYKHNLRKTKDDEEYNVDNLIPNYILKDYFEDVLNKECQDKNIKNKELYKSKKRMILQNYISLDYAYAITCHKAQGSQYNTPLIIYEKLYQSTFEDRLKWLYTAVTRSTNRAIVIVDDTKNL